MCILDFDIIVIIRSMRKFEFIVWSLINSWARATLHLTMILTMQSRKTHPIEHDGSEPERTRGMWIVPNLWKLRSSMPSAVKQGMSQRMCEPRNSSLGARIGALGVRRRFCFARLTFVCWWCGWWWPSVLDGLLSKIETKLGMGWWWWWPVFCHGATSWTSGSESSESGVALRDREPVLQVCCLLLFRFDVVGFVAWSERERCEMYEMRSKRQSIYENEIEIPKRWEFKVNRWVIVHKNVHLHLRYAWDTLPQHHGIRPECLASFLNFFHASFHERCDLEPWREALRPQHGASVVAIRWVPAPMSAVLDPSLWPSNSCWNFVRCCNNTLYIWLRWCWS